MPRCPNCGRDTLRTEDWACQWCGYPLPSPTYKVVAKTYKQLKEERLHKPEAIQKITPEPEPEQRVEEGRESEIEPELEIIKESEPELEPKQEAERIQESEPEPELEKDIEPIQEKQPEPEPAAMELNVEELLSAYETDPVTADGKFVNEVLRVTGVVAAVDVKDFLDTHYIRLTGNERNFLQSVQCMFDKKHAPVLAKLEIGQTVTVQGKFNGSMIAIRMTDCFLVT
jgi:ribosomal protein L37E